MEIVVLLYVGAYVVRVKSTARSAGYCQPPREGARGCADYVPLRIVARSYVARLREAWASKTPGLLRPILFR